MSPPRRHTEVAKSPARMPTRLSLSSLLHRWGRVAFGMHSTMRAAALLPGARLRQKTGNQGPMTPAQISQYAASPIRYGQPPGTVASLLG